MTPEQVRQRDRDRYRANPEKKLAQIRRYRAANSDRVKQANRNWNLKTKYGITVEQYDAMLAAQGGHCKVCPRTSILHVDHNHVTGAVRGILCGQHNRALGLVADDPAVLRSLAEYLENQK